MTLYHNVPSSLLCVINIVFLWLSLDWRLLRLQLILKLSTDNISHLSRHLLQDVSGVEDISWQYFSVCSTHFVQGNYSYHSQMLFHHSILTYVLTKKSIYFEFQYEQSTLVSLNPILPKLLSYIRISNCEIRICLQSYQETFIYFLSIIRKINPKRWLFWTSIPVILLLSFYSTLQLNMFW